MMFNPINLEQNVYGCRIYIPLNNFRVLVTSAIALKDSLNILKNSQFCQLKILKSKVSKCY